MLDSTSISTILLLATASLLLLVAMLHPSSLLRWLQRKRYQYEVTFSLYMLTPTEKFIFSTPLPSLLAYPLSIQSLTFALPDSVLFLLLSLFIIAASLYLPEHVMLIANRMFYYFSGDEQTLTGASANKAAQHVLRESGQMIHGAATSFLGRDSAHPNGAGIKGHGRGYMGA
jgi:hypothetical protein